MLYRVTGGRLHDLRHPRGFSTSENPLPPSPARPPCVLFLYASCDYGLKGLYKGCRRLERGWGRGFRKSGRWEGRQTTFSGPRKEVWERMGDRRMDRPSLLPSVFLVPRPGTSETCPEGKERSKTHRKRSRSRLLIVLKRWDPCRGNMVSLKETGLCWDGWRETYVSRDT